MGWFYFKKGQYKKAIDYYERVFSIRCENPDYYYHLTAVAWAALVDTEKSIHYLDAAIDYGWRARDWTEQEEKLKIYAYLLRMGSCPRTDE